MQQVLTDMIQDWLIHYPLAGWVLMHPLLSLISILVLLLLLGGLLRAVSRLTEVLWVRLLQLPFQAGQWFLSVLIQKLKLQRWLLRPKSISEPRQSQGQIPIVGVEVPPQRPLETTQQQLYDILVRLEGLQQAQMLLLQDIKTLMIQDSSCAQPDLSFMNEIHAKRH